MNMIRGIRGGAKALSLSVAILICYAGFAFLRHREFATGNYDGLSSYVSSVLLLACFPLWVLAVRATFRHRHVMSWPATIFCWIVCGLGGAVVCVFIVGFFAMVLR
jgi:hypothetical protein